MKAHDIFLKAYQIASEAHSGQTRRDGKTPYIKHIDAVIARVKERHETAVLLRDMTEDELYSLMAVAALHDVAEDTSVTAADLLAAGIPQEVVDAVVVMTHPAGERYFDYLIRVKANPLAAKVKVADMLSNLADSPTDRQIVKYAKGLLFLVDGKSESS